MGLKKIFGRRAVIEALRSSQTQVEKIMLARGTHGAILREIQDLAGTRGLVIEVQDRRRLEKFAGPVAHQGVIAILKSREYADWYDILGQAKARPTGTLFVVADEIEDPRNLGAIARCAEGAGARGMVITTHRSAEITESASKASGGAVEHLPIVRVVNLVNTLREMKDAGIWVAGMESSSGQDIWKADLNRPLALVIGGEGKGLRRLTRESCDLLLRIPMRGKINSLNAAVAAGIALFEIRRQQSRS